MTKEQTAWLQIIGGFAMLVFGVFFASGSVEVLLAVLGVYVGIQGFQKLRQV